MVGWRLNAGLAGQNQGWTRPDFDDASWPICSLGDWKRNVPDGAGFDGIGTYRLSFDLDLDPARTTPLALNLEVADDALVYLNGHLIGHYYEKSWERNFWLPDSYLRPRGKNVLAVVVRNHGGRGGLLSAAISADADFTVKRQQILLEYDADLP